MQANYSVLLRPLKKNTHTVIYQYNFFPKDVLSLPAVKSPPPTLGYFHWVPSNTASLSCPHTGLENLGESLCF